jgi:ribonuclease III
MDSSRLPRRSSPSLFPFMRVFEDLERKLDYTFNDPALLKRALTHSSHAHEQNTHEDNEQLEFLGDAILGFLVSDFLFRANPELSEGQLSKLKGFFVSSANLVKYAEQLELGAFLHLGRGEEKTGGRTKQALLVDGFEAILGAMYLDGGLDPVRALASRFFQRQISEIGEMSPQVADFKSALQEALQSRGLERAQYVTTGETGPDHQKLFTVEILVGARSLAHGVGLTKKAAEQAAAKQALRELNQNHERSDLQEINRA